MNALHAQPHGILCGCDMAQFEFALLGTPRIHAHGNPVRFATRKAQALLIYLAVEGTPVSRDKLIDLLWADSDMAHGRVVLRTTLTQLRSRLNERTNGSHAPAISLVIAEGDTLLVNPAADVQVDVRVLDQAYRRTRSHTTSAPSSHDLHAALQQAVAIYTSDFLDGFSSGDTPNFDDWASLQRERWHVRFAAVLDRLSQLQFEGGEFAAGIETVRRWLTHDALNEIAHRRLMQLHLAAGDRAAAMQAYAVCRQILLRELNANPSPETVAVAERLRTQSLPTPPVETKRELARPWVAMTSLIGRTDEHQQLVQVYRAARHGQPQVVVVQGEPGIGKTRLAQEFLGWASAQGAAVLQGVAYELTVSLPYQIWSDGLRNQLTQMQGRAAFDALDTHWQQALARLLPELAGLDAKMEPVADVAGLPGRSELFEATYRLVQQLADAVASASLMPPIIFLDDVQWADEASLDLLQYLTHRCVEDKLPILLLMTLRQEAADVFEPSLAALRRHMPVKILPLNTLTRADSDQLVNALLTQTFTTVSGTTGKPNHQIEHFAQTLFGETAGHPLYLLETLKSLFEGTPMEQGSPLAEADVDHWQTALDGWLAPGVKVVIQSRLNRLSPQATKLVNAVAVLGQRCYFEACYQTAGLAEDAALALLDETTARGLLRETTSGTISFTHDKIREVVYAGITASRRRSLHRRSAETLMQLYENRLDEYVPLVAQHLDACNDPRAWAYFERAGNAAMRLHAYAEAASHFVRAIQLGRPQEQAAPDPAHHRTALANLYFQLGSAHNRMGQWGASLRDMADLAQLANRWGDAELIYRVAVWRAALMAVPSEQMDLDTAEQQANYVLPRARAAGLNIDEANALLALARAAYWRAQFDQALAYGKASLDILQTHDLPTLQGFVLDELVLASLGRNDLAAAQLYQHEAYAFWLHVDHPAMLVYALALGSLILIRRGQFEQALALSQQGFDISRRIDNDWAELASQSISGIALFELGQPDQAIAVLELYIRRSREIEFSLPPFLILVDLANVYAELGACTRGLEAAHAAYQVAERMLPSWRLNVIPTLTRLYTYGGQYAEAASWLERGRVMQHSTRADPWPVTQVLLELAAAELALAQQDGEQALQSSMAGVAACRAQGWRQMLPAGLLLQARAQVALGRLDEASSTLLLAHEAATAIRSQWQLWQILDAFSLVEALRGNDAQAQHWAEHANAIVDSIRERLDDVELRAAFSQRRAGRNAAIAQKSTRAESVPRTSAPNRH